MKRLLILLVLALMVGSLFATDLMQSSKKQAITRENVLETSKVKVSATTREAPEFEFVVDPTGLVTNYYDYMPGSYNSTPVRVQPDAFGGVYITFHARETSGSTRREYYVYVDGTGTVTNTGTIGTQDLHEGYSGLDIDPETGDPIVSWHVNSDDTTPDLECVATYDLYHLGAPGLWVAPFDVITDDLPSPNGTSDEFIWPYIHIGPSPEAGKRRVYLQTNNAYSATDPSENPMIAYADFDVNDFNMQSTLDWTYITIPIFDNWNQSNPEWIRPMHSFDVSKVDGRVAFFGYNTNDELYVCYNDNYGEGDWTYVADDVAFDTWNPQNLDGSYVFEDEDGNPQPLYWAPIHAGHQTSVFMEGSNKIHMGGTLGLQVVDTDSYYPYELFPYTFQYDFVADEFSFWVQDPTINENAVNPNYEYSQNEVYIPWDTDLDDEVDEYNDDGAALMFNDWPIYFWDSGVGFHENLFKMAVNDENNWLVNIWSNSIKSKYYNDSGDQNYVDWANIAELYITVSSNGGDTWSEPIIMNAKTDDENFVSQFDGMHPAYVYCSDKIEDMGDDWGKVHLMFLDDNSYGSIIQGFGEDLGGTMNYAAIKIHFPPTGSEDPTIVPATAQLSQNYPNPFNPTTTIAYNVNQASNVKIDVYNVRGQFVTNLVNTHKDAGEHTIVWNGKDKNNQEVTSGVYYYKMKSGRYTSTKKMILLK